MSKLPTLSSILSGFGSIAKLNANFSKITTAFQNTLSLDGSTPNSMAASLDMNSNRIINLSDPVDNTDATTKDYVDDAVDSIQTSQFALLDLSNVSNANVASKGSVGGLATDSAVVHNTGTETIAGSKKFTSPVKVDESGQTPSPYSVGVGFSYAPALGSNARFVMDVAKNGGGTTLDGGLVSRVCNGTFNAPTAILSGDRIGLTGAQGYMTTAYSTGSRAYVAFYAAGNWTDTSTPTRIRLATNNGTATVESWELSNLGNLLPTTDNTYQIGSASFRIKEYFGAAAAINTSDEREKQWRGALSSAELRASKNIGSVIGIYQWLDAIAEKGESEARLHTGVKAQEVHSLMAAEGLDPFKYGFLCYDAWEESEVPSGDEENPTFTTIAAGDRWGIRPNELLFFIVAGQEQRLRALEDG